MAGDKARHLDLGTAWNLYRRALDYTDTSDPRRPEILAKAMELADLAGTLPLDEVEAGFREAIEAFRQAGDPLRMGEAMRKLAATLRVRGRTQQSREILDQAVELLEREPPSPALAQVYSAIAGHEMLASTTVTFLPWTEKSLELGQRFDLKPVIVRSLQLRGIGRAEQGDAGGLDDLGEAVRMGVEWGLPAESGPAYVNWADWTATYGDPAASLGIYQEGIEFCLKHGAGRPVSWAKAETTWRLFDLGRWDEVIEVADEVARWEEQHGGPAQPGVISGIEKMHVLTYRGGHEEAARLESELLPRAREIGDPQVLWQALAVVSVGRLGRGDREGARSAVKELVATAAGATAVAYYLIPEALRVMLVTGETETVRGIVEEEEGAIPTVLTRHVVGRAALAEADGNLEKAVAGYRQAAAAWERGGFVFHRANALLAAARCLLLLGMAAEATQELSMARQIFAGLGADPLARECDDLLSEATAVSP